MDRIASSFTALSVVVWAVLCFALVRCNEAPQFGESLVRTTTVAVESASSISFDLPVSTEFDAQLNSSDIFIDFDVVLTASTAERAKQLRDDIAFEITRDDDGNLQLVLPEPFEASIGGALTVRMPRALELSVIQRQGNTVVADFTESVEVISNNSIRIEGARQDVRALSEGGNIIVETRAPPGSLTELRTAQGDVELLLPTRPSALIQADIAGVGELRIAHPALPQPITGNQIYTAEVLGSLADIQLFTQSGNIVIGQAQ